MHLSVLDRLLLPNDKKDWDVAIVYSTGKAPQATWKKTAIKYNAATNTIFLTVDNYPNQFVEQDPSGPERTMKMDAFIDVDSITAVDYLKENKVQKVTSKIIT